MSLVQPSARLAGLGTTVFTRYSALARELGAVNLGQGVPSAGPPRALIESARAAIGIGRDQYPMLSGAPELRQAIVEDRRRRTGVGYDPDREVLVTVGATEALTAAILALAGPGDDVVVLEPAYDSYAAAVDLAGARLVTVPLALSEEGRFVPDEEALRDVVSERTRVVIINSPHNPSGTVLTAVELAAIARALAAAPSAVVVSDEVYERLVLDGSGAISPSVLPGLAERTVVISSAGKTFSATGWKVGWALGPAELIDRVRAVKQYLTFSVNEPFQLAVADGLSKEDAWVDRQVESLRARRDLLYAGLEEAGFEVLPSSAGYFVLARPAGGDARADLADRLAVRAGVVAIPGWAFHRESAGTGGARAYVRFAFCRDEADLRLAIDRLATYASAQQ